MNAAPGSGGLCPSCGAANPPWVDTCLRCNARLTAAVPGPIPASSPPPPPPPSAGGSPYYARPPEPQPAYPGAPAVYYPGPSPPRKSRRRLVVVVAVVVVIVVAVLGVLLSGVVPGFSLANIGSSSGGGGVGTANPTSFDQAAVVANSTAAGTGSGPWLVSYAGGFSAPVNIPGSEFSPLQNHSEPGCTDRGGSSPPTIPANAGSYSDGKMVGWYFILYDSSHETAAYVLVLGSNGILLGTVTGECSAVTTLSTGGGWSIDSPQVAAAVSSASGGFTSTYTTGYGELVFRPGTPRYDVDSQWIVFYAACSPTGSSFSIFMAYVDGVTGIVSNQYTESEPTNCTTALPFGGAEVLSGSVPPVPASGSMPVASPRKTLA